MTQTRVMRNYTTTNWQLIFCIPSDLSGAALLGRNFETCAMIGPRRRLCPLGLYITFRVIELLSANSALFLRCRDAVQLQPTKIKMFLTRHALSKRKECFSRWRLTRILQSKASTPILLIQKPKGNALVMRRQKSDKCCQFYTKIAFTLGIHRTIYHFEERLARTK